MKITRQLRRLLIVKQILLVSLKKYTEDSMEIINTDSRLERVTDFEIVQRSSTSISEMNGKTP